MNKKNMPRYLLLMVFVAGISLLHYLTPLRLPMLHDIFQRLYYIPIILAAFWFGIRGGLMSAIVVSVLYAPHILFQWGGHMSMELEKYLEILLYNVVGGVTGILSQKERARSFQLQETARGLERSYAQLSRQSDRIMEMESQLRKAERLSTIGELAAVLAHEVRNPLGSIQGTAEILKDSYQPGDEKYEFLEIMIKETRRLNNVVEDFLRFARPQPVLMGDCDLTEELNNVVALVASEARKRNIMLNCDLGRLPSLEGDSEKLRQAFLNIMLNGLQATPSGGSIFLTSSCEESVEGSPGWVEITAADTGPGIPPGELSRIFEPFFTTKEGGTGLGLSITRKIIEAHGGRISVESELGSGTTVRVRLPEKRG